MPVTSFAFQATALCRAPRAEILRAEHDPTFQSEVLGETWVHDLVEQAPGVALTYRLEQKTGVIRANSEATVVSLDPPQVVLTAPGLHQVSTTSVSSEPDDAGCHRVTWHADLEIQQPGPAWLSPTRWFKKAIHRKGQRTLERQLTAWVAAIENRWSESA
jgi:hypothetical protein